MERPGYSPTVAIPLSVAVFAARFACPTDRQLAESAWFHEGRKWHAFQASAGEFSKNTPRTG